MVAARSGVSVKTIRFYCDQGLLQVAGLSEGSYRLFDESVDSDLALIRTLRGLDIPLPTITAVLEARRSGGVLLLQPAGHDPRQGRRDRAADCRFEIPSCRAQRTAKHLAALRRPAGSSQCRHLKEKSAPSVRGAQRRSAAEQQRSWLRRLPHPVPSLLFLSFSKSSV